jgi:hypothetical protein
VRLALELLPFLALLPLLFLVRRLALLLPLLLERALPSSSAKHLQSLRLGLRVACLARDREPQRRRLASLAKEPQRLRLPCLAQEPQP